MGPSWCPPSPPKTQVSLRLDQDVIAAFRAQGPGWQSRMNEALRKAAGVQGEGAGLECTVVVEHNLDVIKTADWVIDLGPDGGVKGGDIVAVGTPEAIAGEKANAKGFYLKPLLEKERAEMPVVKRVGRKAKEAVG